MIASAIKKAQAGLLVAGYPLIIYLLLTHNAAWLGAVLVVGAIIWKLRGRHDWYWWLAGLLLVLSVAGRLFGVDAIPKLTPLLIHAGLFYLFAHSLKGTPLIERFARLDFDELPPGIPEYCRKLTVLWSGFFALNILVCLWLALWGDDKLWVLYNGLIVYVLIVGLMLGEYVWRHFAFPGLEIPPLSHSMRNMIKNGHKIWGSDKHEGA
jgi:uncharacterized membrane protein